MIIKAVKKLFILIQKCCVINHEEIYQRDWKVELNI